ncbi:MAG: 3-dehydroquinate synthase [bacterium]
MKIKTIKVKIPDIKVYEVTLGADLLSDAGRMARKIFSCENVFIVSNQKVIGLYGDTVKKSFSKAGFKVNIALIGDGEKYKSIKSYELINEQLAARYGRYEDFFIATLGGGVVEDLSGFVASTYNRFGVDIMQIPTTLLAMVDCSVGGKVAINLKAGKNLVGAFHQPRLIINDLSTLKTLPKREMLAGFAEVIKYAIGFDKTLFSNTEDNYGSFIGLKNLDLMTDVVKRCVEIKTSIVEQDETEQKGLRTLLNLGHTFAHAIEASTKYRRYKHGEAVAIGLVTAAKISNRMKILPGEDYERIVKLIKNCGFPTHYKGCTTADLMETMKRDKKFKSGVRRYVLPLRIGKCKVFENISLPLIRQVLNEQCFPEL